MGRPALTTIKRVQRSEEVRRQLDEAIRRGDYAPGDRLPSERELVEAFGVSRVSVREGIRLLEALGRVTVRHGSGVYVADRRSGLGEPMTRWLDVHRDEVLELVTVRASLDALAAEEAAVRADEASIDHIVEIHTAFVALADGKAPVDDIVERDTDFHLAIAEASCNRLLYDLLTDLNSYLESSRLLSLQAPGRAQASAREHARIVAALVARDRDEARDAMIAHLEAVQGVLRQGNPGWSRDRRPEAG
jgi:GntR family transcriptional repressor for pyruvate dehydrogenase complex